jgi:hypothetical protein
MTTASCLGWPVGTQVRRRWLSSTDGGRAHRLVGAALVACLVGCGGDPPASPLPFFFPINVLSAQAGGPAALITGRLEMEGKCLVVSDPTNAGPAFLIGWPNRAAPGIDEAGAPIVLVDGTIVARAGEPISLGGGAYESRDAQSFARTKLSPNVPCSGPVWLAWDVLPPGEPNELPPVAPSMAVRP